MKEHNILIIAGGTGGHISPGLALYEEFKEKGAAVRILSGKKDIRFSYLREIGDDLLLYGAPSFSKNIFKLIVFPFRFLIALLRSLSLLKKGNVTAVIGMGGYVSAPMLLAAKMREVSLYLCEQNAVPGKVTRYFSKYAETVFTTFEVSRNRLVFPERCVHVGNPIRKKVFLSESKESARAFFNMKHCRQIILVIGGSQGAVEINELMFGLKKAYPEKFKGVGIIWSTGEYSYNRYKERIHKEMDEGSVFLSPFISNVGRAYLAGDVAISRAGAGVMMELAAVGLPSILIPFHFAADNHQELNADEFSREGAAIKVKSDNAKPEVFGPILFDLLENRARLDKMKDRLLSVSKRNAAAEIVSYVLNEGASNV